MKKIIQVLLFTLMALNIINAKASAANSGTYSFNFYYVNFSPKCKSATPEFMRLGSKHAIGGKEVVFLRISCDEYPQKAKEAGITTYPTFLLLDPAGKIIARYEGERNAEAMIAFLNQILQ
jgi:thiol-disulfide isomerase/thioredoxin